MTDHQQRGIAEYWHLVTLFVEKLSGEDGKYWQEAAERFLHNDVPCSLPSIKTCLPTWRAVVLGCVHDAESYRLELLAKGCNLSDGANFVLERIDVAKVQREVRLVKKTVAELGFKKEAHYDDICARASKEGLSQCLPEVAAALRRAYVDQDKGETLYIAMDPVPGRDGHKCILYLSNEGGRRHLLSEHCNPKSRWYPTDCFAFCVTVSS